MLRYYSYAGILSTWNYSSNPFSGPQVCAPEPGLLEIEITNVAMLMQ